MGLPVRGLSDERCFWRSSSEVLRGRYLVGEGDSESVERVFPRHGLSCLTRVLGVQA